MNFVNAQSSPRRLARRILSVTLALLVIVAMIAAMPGAALAAKGGGGHGGSGTTTSATVAVAPDPVGVGVEYTVSGCGYKAGAPLDIKLYTATATVILFTGGDATGCFAITNSTWEASSIRVEVWQYSGKWALKGTTSFVVQ